MSRGTARRDGRDGDGGRRGGGRPATRSDGGRSTLRFSGPELRDLGVAWLALSFAFALYFAKRTILTDPLAAIPIVIVMLVTVGMGFLLHELAHKVVAVRFGQLAEFRADYGMLFLAVMGGLVGLIFAAPGAVHHRGRISDREHGIIAVAGPVTNLVLAVAFLPVILIAPSFGSTFIGGFGVGELGVGINLLLAAFNMIPFGPLDGRTVLDWSPVVFAVVFIPSVALVLRLFFLF